MTQPKKQLRHSGMEQRPNGAKHKPNHSSHEEEHVDYGMKTENTDGQKPPVRKHRAPRYEKADKIKQGDKHQKAPKTQEPAKPHAMRNPRELVVDTLIRIENGGFSNIVWDLAIKHADLNNLDKMLATRIFYGTLSNMRLIDALWSDIEPEMVKRADPVVKMTLRSAMYQLVFLDRVPAYSIVSTSVDVVKRLRNRAASGYCNALLRKAVARQETGQLKFRPSGDKLSDFAVEYSLNDDLAKCLLDEFGDEARDIAESMQSVPRMVLRVNRSKLAMETLLSQSGASLEKSAVLPEQACLVVSRNEVVERMIETGKACVQDEAAQMAVLALGGPENWGQGSERDVHIWDACAGLGGKSIHILDEIACSEDKGRFSLLSTDLYANKLERLKDYQLQFFGGMHLVTKVRDLQLGGSVPLAPFDAILIDAPCSGLGVLRRHPEVKLTRTQADIESLVELQKQILNQVCRHLRVGGVLVYSVCTITRAECENQVEQFLGDHPNFRLDTLPEVCLGNRPDSGQIKLLPHKDGCDGFYVARFVRVS